MSDDFKGKIILDECVETMDAIVSDPVDVIGDTKDSVIEFIKDNLDNYNTMVVMATLVVAGVNTMQATKSYLAEQHEGKVE